MLVSNSLAQNLGQESDCLVTVKSLTTQPEPSNLEYVPFVNYLAKFNNLKSELWYLEWHPL